MSATWGKNFKITIFGQSHSPAVGVVIDGIPAGIKPNFEYISHELKRRQGGDSFSTPRKEDDNPEILSGLFEGKTAGAPLCAVFKNRNTKSSDYDALRFKMRPSHADYPAFVKHEGFNDFTGGGHFSGRLTLPLTFAGALAKSILEEKGILVASHIKKINAVDDLSFYDVDIEKTDLKDLKNHPFPLLDTGKEEEMKQAVLKAKNEGDSVGGIIECIISGLDAGIGEPFFDSLESVISHLVFSVPAVKGIEFGKGFSFAEMTGYAARDEYYYDEKGNVKTKQNNNGGILGGITNGQNVIFSAAVKPTASISKKMNTIDVKNKENTEIEIKGRHDPVIVKRALPVIEACAALAVLDLMMEV